MSDFRFVTSTVHIFTANESEIAARLMTWRRRLAFDTALKPGFGVTVYKTSDPTIWVRCLGTLKPERIIALGLTPYIENALPFTGPKAV